MVHAGRAVPRHPYAAANRAGTLLAHSELSKEKRKLVGGFGFFVVFLFVFLIAKREGWLKKQASQADTWGNLSKPCASQTLCSPSPMLDGIKINLGRKLGAEGTSNPR